MSQQDLPLNKPPKCSKGEHDYRETSYSRGNFESETYICRKCGDMYKIYYEDMK